jgi:hypothetical protein
MVIFTKQKKNIEEKIYTKVLKLRITHKPKRSSKKNKPKR